MPYLLDCGPGLPGRRRTPPWYKPCIGGGPVWQDIPGPAGLGVWIHLLLLGFVCPSRLPDVESPVKAPDWEAGVVTHSMSTLSSPETEWEPVSSRNRHESHHVRGMVGGRDFGLSRKALRRYSKSSSILGSVVFCDFIMYLPSLSQGLGGTSHPLKRAFQEAHSPIYRRRREASMP